MKRECKESVQLTFTELYEFLNLDETQCRRQILECAAMEVARGMAGPGRDETRFGMGITKIMQNPSSGASEISQVFYLSKMQVL